MRDIVGRLRVDSLLGLPGAGIIGACREAADEIESLRQQLAEKDGEIERLKEELTTAAIDIKKAIDESRKVLVADWTEKFSLQQQQLAASQAREAQLREALEDANDFVERHSNRWDGINGKHPYTVFESSRKALALPQDTIALEAMIAEAGEVMRERCSDSAHAEMDEQYTDSSPWYAARACREAIRDIPCVTLEDLQ